MVHNKQKLGGNGITVEIDEFKLGKYKYHPGYELKGQWAFEGHELVPKDGSG